MSWNPVRARNKMTGGIGHFCVHASDGCRNCYAEALQPRFQNPIRYAAQDLGKVDIFLDDKVLSHPLGWRKPRMVFVCSMTDLFGEWVTDDMLDRIFAVMALCPQHTFQVLTKRSERMRKYLSRCTLEQLAASIPTPSNMRYSHHEATTRITGGPLGAAELYRCKRPTWPLRNCWLGVSVEDQTRADERIPILLDTPAAVRWVSAEPLLGPIDLTSICTGWHFIDALVGFKYHDEGNARESCPSLGWVVAGDESGPGQRPCDEDWHRSLRDQCAAAGVPFHLKQRIIDGRKTGNPPLDGVIHDAFPTLGERLL